MEKIMEKIYPWVTSNDAWNDGYFFHSNYFVDEKAFLYAFLTALGIGIAVAAIFYFGFCNGKTAKYATHSNWSIALILACVAAFFVGNALYIGGEKLDDNGNRISSSGFYESCEKYGMDKLNNESDFRDNEEQGTALRNKYNDIITALHQGQDVALPFNITNTVISFLVFILASFGMKNFTKHGSAIPLKIRNFIKF